MAQKNPWMSLYTYMDDEEHGEDAWVRKRRSDVRRIQNK